MINWWYQYRLMWHCSNATIFS